jgi:hypothetical protein
MQRLRLRSRRREKSPSSTVAERRARPNAVMHAIQSERVRRKCDALREVASAVAGERAERVRVLVLGKPEGGYVARGGVASPVCDLIEGSG